MSGMTRGRLPARVYWVRRLMVLGIALLLVVGIARLLGGSSDGQDAAATVGDTTTSQAPSDGASTRTHHRQHHKPTSDHTVTPAAQPSGPCKASDVAITPSVPKPVAGSDITLVLDISSIDTPACTWTISPKTLALKITSGKDLIWSTTDCARVVPTQDLTLRQADPTKVKVTWSARRSEPGCPVRTEWALPGTYHLQAAALAGQPQETAFVLTAPTPAEVTQTADPHQHDGHKKHKKTQRPPG